MFYFLYKGQHTPPRHFSRDCQLPASLEMAKEELLKVCAHYKRQGKGGLAQLPASKKSLNVVTTSRVQVAGLPCRATQPAKLHQQS